MARATPHTARRGWIVDAALLLTLKAGICVLVLRTGFSHVSDDDYARTVIAEQFAYAPHLDPSGTSWLPFPFWLSGAIMLAFGRSLGVARGLAVVLGTISVALPYGGLRAAGVARLPAVVATGIAMALPWNAWLGVATVPEGWTGALAGAALIAISNRRMNWVVASCLFVASLSRYEAWPACALFAAVFLARITRAKGHMDNLACALICAAGPLLWMAWNAHAHGDPIHFLARVSAFRRAIGAAAVPVRDKLLGYPIALVAGTPEVASFGAVGIVGIVASAVLRRRWCLGFAACLATFAFLIAGDLRDGAPTHHAERALSPLWWVLIGMGVDAVAMAITGARRRLNRLSVVLVATASVAWAATLPQRWTDAPGSAGSERRDAQIARGLDMRRRGVPDAIVTPCAFEHFALLAAWGRPERARQMPSLHRPATANCPIVEERSPSAEPLAQ